MTNQVRRLILLAFIAGGTIVTQDLVSASASVIERSNQTDSLLVALIHTVTSAQGSLGRLVGAGDGDLRAGVRDFDAEFDRILARIDPELPSTPLERLDLGAIDVERRAFVHAVDVASAPDSSTYLATGWQAIDLQARKLMDAILWQREVLEMTKSRALLKAEMMVALSSGVALLMIGYFLWRPIIAVRAALNHRRWVAPLFVHHR